MASGRLGSADLTAATSTVIYTVPSNKIASFTVNLCNRSSASALVRIAMATSNPPALADYLEYDAIIPANGVLERTGLVLDAGKSVVVYASITGVSAVTYGFEDAA